MAPCSASACATASNDAAFRSASVAFGVLAGRSSLARRSGTTPTVCRNFAMNGLVKIVAFAVKRTRRGTA